MSDLLYSKACIDWAVSQFPSFQQRLDAWLDANLDLILRDIEANPKDDLLILIEKEPFPLHFSVEVGAYINAMRSSLDILATALAHRHRIPSPDEHSFPIASSRSQFVSGKKFKGSKLLQALPAAERRAIEFLKPYPGGNDLLWALHALNNVSKHRKLLDVDTTPARVRIIGCPGFTQVGGRGFVKGNGETVLGFVPKTAFNVKMQIAAHVTVEEAGLLKGKHILTTLHDFARLATSIIDLFD